MVYYMKMEFGTWMGLLINTAQVLQQLFCFTFEYSLIYVNVDYINEHWKYTMENVFNEYKVKLDS